MCFSKGTTRLFKLQRLHVHICRFLYFVRHRFWYDLLSMFDAFLVGVVFSVLWGQTSMFLGHVFG